MSSRDGATAKGPSPLPRVRSVEPLEGFHVRLVFTDGTRRDLNLDRFLRGPVFDEIRRDRILFQQVAVDRELGTIVWPNGADIDPDVLHGDFEPAPGGNEP